MPRRRMVAVGALVAVALVGAFLVSGAPSGLGLGRDDGNAPAAAPAEAVADALAPAVPRPETPTQTTTSPTAPTTGADHATPPGPPPTVEGPVLLVRLVGLDPAAAAAPEILVFGSGAPRWSELVRATPHGPVGPADTFAIGIGELFVDGAAPIGLDVRVDLAGYLYATAKGPLRAATASRPEGPPTYAIDVPVVRAATIAGTVVDERDAPMLGARVGAVTLGADGPAESASEAVETDAGGRYRVRVPAAGRQVVVAVADGAVPGCVEVSAVLGREVESLTIRLALGVAVEGSVRRTDGEPLPGLDVTAEPVGDAPRLVRLTLRNGSGVTARWAAGGVLPDRREAKTDDAGRFRIGGLLPGTHRVGVMQGRWDSVSRTIGAVFGGMTREVGVPASGVDFTADVVRLRVAVRSQGKPVGGAMVHLEAGRDSVGLGAGDDGELDFGVRPGQEYGIWVEAEGYRPARLRVTAPAPGDPRVEVIEMERLADPGAIVVRFRGPGTEAIAVAGYHFRTGAGAHDGPQPPVRVVDGAFRIERAPAGRVVLAVTPDGPVGGTSGWWTDAVATVEVPSGGEIGVEMAVHRGGRLRVAAKDRDGAFVRAQTALVGPTGPVSPIFWYWTDGASTSYTGMGATAAGPSDLVRVLPPGAYTLTLSLAGHRSCTLPFAIREGETTPVEATLDPE